MIFPHSLRLPLDFDPDLLARDLGLAAQPGWTRHFIRDVYDGEWDMIALRAPKGARRAAQLTLFSPMAEAFEDTDVLARCPYFRVVLESFRCALRQVRLMRLAPGTVIKEHIDQFLDIEDGAVRLHVPIRTNDAVDFRVAGRRVVMLPGTTWYVAVGEPHSVANRGAADRVHLVIDATLDKWLVDLFEAAEGC